MSDRDDVLDFQPPPVEVLWRRSAPLRAYHRPRFFGLDNIDAGRPSLLVGNHTIFGVLDIPFDRTTDRHPTLRRPARRPRGSRSTPF